MKKKYDVCAIGNAVIDYEIMVNDEFFSDHNIEKGLMTLVEEDRQQGLLTAAKGQIKKRQGGGSAANTAFGLAEFGGSGFYTCKVGDDEDGHLFVKDLKAAAIDSNLDEDNLFKGITGKCLVMVTPDSERTMNTFLGITSNFSEDELSEEAIKNSNYLFIEGFLVSSPTALVAMKKAKKLAIKHGVKTSLTFSDPAMVKYFGDQMKEVVGDGLDLLFCNEEEALLYTGAESLEEAKNTLQKVADQFVITLGEKGSLVFDGTAYIEIPPFPTKAVDSTGAGDMFAGAFLYGINHGFGHEKAGKLASLASATIVGKYGPRLEPGQATALLKQL